VHEVDGAQDITHLASANAHNIIAQAPSISATHYKWLAPWFSACSGFNILSSQHRRMDQDFQSILSQCGGLPPQAFTLPSQHSQPADSQMMLDDPITDYDDRESELGPREFS
jgi:hypothetical protein